MVDPQKVWILIEPYVKGAVVTVALLIWLGGIWPMKKWAPNKNTFYMLTAVIIGLAMATASAWLHTTGITFFGFLPLKLTHLGFALMGIGVMGAAYYWRKGRVEV